MTQTYKHQIPTAKEFTTLKKTDLLYALLQTKSKWTGQEGTPRYVNKEDVVWSKLRRELKVSSVKTVKSRFNKLVEAGFIKETDFTYELIVETLYTTVSTETLTFLIDTANDDVINVYAFLKWKHEFSKSKGNEFYFYNKQIVEDVLDLTYDSRTNTKINNILTSLENNGLISYTEEYIGDFKKRKVLKEVKQYHKKKEAPAAKKDFTGKEF